MADEREKGPTIKRTAGEAVALLLPVALIEDEAFVADNTNPAHRRNIYGISVEAASLVGQQQRIQTYGPYSNLAWSWTPDAPIYVGAGVLTQTRPTSGFVVQIAVARTATAIWIDPADLTDIDKNYHHVQSLPATTWVIEHGLNKRPAVTVVDSSGKVVFGEVTHDTDTQATVRFTAAFSGSAYCN